MRVSTLSRWFWRFSITGLLLYAALTFLPPAYWPWKWMDFFQRPREPLISDTNFVVIDVGQLSRSQIALLLKKVATQKPRSIVLDLYFPDRRDPAEDSLLRETLCQVASEVPLYLPTDIGDATTPSPRPAMQVSDSFFTECPRKAFANLLYQERLGGRIVRYARLYHRSARGFEPSLAWAAVQHLDSTLSPATFPASRYPIRYRGNISCFYFLSGKDLLQDTLMPPILLQKAVFLGLADLFYQYNEDLFFTPAGVRLFAHTAPDMYGVLIHANIASMLYHRALWKELPPLLLYLLGGVGLILMGLVADNVHRYVWVRLTQLGLFLLFGALFTYLAEQGYWIEAEETFLALLISGEVCLFTAPGRKPPLA